MAKTAQPLLAVIGSTGAQGRGVVEHVTAGGDFRVRALTRRPDEYAGAAAEVRRADLSDPGSLSEAFAGARAVFAVTNFWEPGGIDETAQGKAAVRAAREAGVRHFIWSTLPNVRRLSGGRYDVPHFSDKAEVDRLVAEAGFEVTTFVEPPFYFQNFAGMLAPQPSESGTRTWTLPIDPAARVIDMGDVGDLGKVVAGALEQPDETNGQHLALSADRFSFEDVMATLRDQGHDVGFNRVDRETFSGFFPGAAELAEMFAYFEEFTYFGPGAGERIARARAVATGDYVDFATWARANMPVEAG